MFFINFITPKSKAVINIKPSIMIIKTLNSISEFLFIFIFLVFFFLIKLHTSSKNKKSL